MQRIIVSHQLAPSVAFAVRRAEYAWLIIVNPGLSRADRTYSETLAGNLIDNIESEWTYQPPAGGVDILIGAQMAAVSRVVEAETSGAEIVRMVGGLAGALVLPMTGCAWMAHHLASVLLQAHGIGA